MPLHAKDDIRNDIYASTDQKRFQYTERLP